MKNDSNCPYFTTLAGLKMPVILYGTAWKKENTDDLVALALQTGFRGIDTACQPKHYEESLVGAAIERLEIKRENLFLQTKFTPVDGQNPDNIPYDANLPIKEQITASFEVSKSNLRTHFIDSYLLHSPIFPHADLLKAWRTMESIYNRGEVGQLGISNCYELPSLKRLFADAKIKPAIVQNRFCNQTNYDKELRAWCREQGIIYQSFWSLTANPHLLGSQTFFDLARRYKVSEAQIMYRFLTQIGIAPLNGTTNQQHMKADLQIFEFELTPEEVEEIEGILK
ncbi:MAG: aldo/keto reductase family protein [Microcystaceae cyanobacterium]